MNNVCINCNIHPVALQGRNNDPKDANRNHNKKNPKKKKPVGGGK